MKTKMLLSEFNLLDPAERMQFVREGNEVLNDPPKPKTPMPDNSMTRTHFNTCDEAGNRRAIGEGRIIVDVE